MKCMTQEEIDKEREEIQAYVKELFDDPERLEEFFKKVLACDEQIKEI